MIISSSNYIKVYVNGVLAGENNLIGAFSPWNDFNIGMTYPDSQNRYFKGKIDAVRIWNDIRTETEIRQNMYRELPNPSGETNLIAYYKFNETSGTSATDTKGSYDGTLTNFGGQSGYWQTSRAMFGPKNALAVDGSNDFISIPGSAANTSSSFTTEFWLKMDRRPVFF